MFLAFKCFRYNVSCIAVAINLKFKLYHKMSPHTFKQVWECITSVGIPMVYNVHNGPAAIRIYCAGDFISS